MLVKRQVANLAEEIVEVVDLLIELMIDEKVSVYHRRRHRLQPGLTIPWKSIVDQRVVWEFVSETLSELGIDSYPPIPFDNRAVIRVT